MDLPVGSEGNRLLAVFSHPHEPAVFGSVQRLRPHLLFLTDGGGPQRVAETQAGLGAIGAAQRARFLNHSEASFYEALVHGRIDFCRRVAAQIAAGDRVDCALNRACGVSESRHD